MKILCIGDPHGSEKIKEIPLKGIDLILLTGDIGKADLAREQAFTNIKRREKGLLGIEYSSKERKKAFMEIYNSSLMIVKYLSKFAPVYTIYGNVENSNSGIRDLSKKIGIKLPFLTPALNSMKNVRVINNRIANFNGVRIGGLEYFVDTNWVKEFKPSEYKERLKEAKKESDKAKRILKNFKNLDILLCHQPPYGVLDKMMNKKGPKSWYGKHAGSKVILDYIKKKNPQYVFCGHMHESKGKRKIGKTEVYNLGCCGEYAIIDID